MRIQVSRRRSFEVSTARQAEFGAGQLSPQPAPFECKGRGGIERGPHPRLLSQGGYGRGTGFTLIELLVVIAIIILLLSIVIVAVNAATKTAQKANTQGLMSSISQALVQFNTDLTYLPPALDRTRALFNPPDPDAAGYNATIQNWYSYTTLADYLIGWDGRGNDGYGDPFTGAGFGELPRGGIRNPGSDAVWSAVENRNPPAAVVGSLDARNPDLVGRVYGPYLELKDAGLLGAINGADANGNPTIVFPDQVNNFDALPKVVVDYWGNPIRYYRRPYPYGGIRQAYRAVDRNGDGVIDRVPTLSDFIALRPFDAGRESDIVDTFIADTPDVGGLAPDTASSRRLDSGEFALFSAGPDKASAQTRRIDVDEFNRDNVVEVGP